MKNVCSRESLVAISRDQGDFCMVKKIVVTVIKRFAAALIKEGIISLESYKNDTWVPLIYELRTKGIELKLKAA